MDAAARSRARGTRHGPHSFVTRDELAGALPAAVRLHRARERLTDRLG